MEGDWLREINKICIGENGKLREFKLLHSSSSSFQVQNVKAHVDFFSELEPHLHSCSFFYTEEIAGN